MVLNLIDGAPWGWEEDQHAAGALVELAPLVVCATVWDAVVYKKFDDADAVE
jgi:hypothetical protein